MKKLLFICLAFISSCEVKTIEVPVKGGEIAIGPNTCYVQQKLNDF